MNEDKDLNGLGDDGTPKDVIPKTKIDGTIPSIPKSTMEEEQQPSAKVPRVTFITKLNSLKVQLKSSVEEWIKMESGRSKKVKVSPCCTIGFPAGGCIVLVNEEGVKSYPDSNLNDVEIIQILRGMIKKGAGHFKEMDEKAAGMMNA